MDITLSEILPYAALLLSLASPLISSLINSRSQFRMQRFHFFDEHYANVTENYLRQTGAVLKNRDSNNFTDYGKTLGEIYLYAPLEIWAEIESVDYDITHLAITDETDKAFTHICQALSDNPPRVPKKRRKENNK